MMSFADYEKAAEIHTSKDREVSMQHAEEIAKQLKGNKSSRLKISNVGEDHKHESRHRKTFIVHSMNIAELYLLTPFPVTRNIESGCPWKVSMQRV